MTQSQNHLSDLYGLLVFLKLEPLHDRAYFTRCLERPLKNGEPSALQRLQVMQRRSQRQCCFLGQLYCCNDGIPLTNLWNTSGKPLRSPCNNGRECHAIWSCWLRSDAGVHAHA